MKTAVIGLGVQGRKRRAIAGEDLAGTVDPVNPDAEFKNVQDVPLASFESALVCTPDGAKFDVISYLLGNGKHVLVEKPLLFEHSKQISHLEKLARENRVTCYTAYNHRFEPHIARLKQLLDGGTIGKVYRVSIFYGNGTARDVKNSIWRDKGMGVISDLGSHMLDMGDFLFGARNLTFKLWSSNRFENNAPDQALFGSQSKEMLVTMEGSLLSWRNTFHLDVWAEKGSAHIDGLCKWGPSTLTVRKRVLPSGKPLEERNILEQPDPTWAAEYVHFKQLCKMATCNLENDIWINDTLNILCPAAQEKQ